MPHFVGQAIQFQGTCGAAPCLFNVVGKRVRPRGFHVSFHCLSLVAPRPPALTPGVLLLHHFPICGTGAWFEIPAYGFDWYRLA